MVCCEPYSRRLLYSLKGYKYPQVDIFLEFSCFSYDPMDVVNLISGSVSFLNPACTFKNSQFMYWWNLDWRIFPFYFRRIQLRKWLTLRQQSKSKCGGTSAPWTFSESPDLTLLLYVLPTIIFSLSWLSLFGLLIPPHSLDTTTTVGKLCSFSLDPIALERHK